MGNLHVLGWAVVPKGTTDLCFTSAPEVLGGGTIWQIYKNEEDAIFFRDAIPWGDGSEYEIVEVTIDVLAPTRLRS